MEGGACHRRGGGQLSAPSVRATKGACLRGCSGLGGLRGDSLWRLDG